MTVQLATSNLIVGSIVTVIYLLVISMAFIKRRKQFIAPIQIRLAMVLFGGLIVYAMFVRSMIDLLKVIK
jgi:hypothetical protein